MTPVWRLGVGVCGANWGNVVEISYLKQILQFELFDTFYMNMVLRSDPER